jgi:hypothetical protein
MECHNRPADGARWVSSGAGDRVDPHLNIVKIECIVSASQVGPGELEKELVSPVNPRVGSPCGPFGYSA